MSTSAKPVFDSAVYAVDFEESYGKGSKYFRILEKLSDKSQATYDKAKLLYEKNRLDRIQLSETPKIPKIIHQMWLGNRAIPEKCQCLMASWKRNHPHWEYRLWTDKEGLFEKSCGLRFTA